MKVIEPSYSKALASSKLTFNHFKSFRDCYDFVKIVYFVEFM